MSDEKPIRLFLVRHGNTFESGQTPVQVGARTDLPLTKTGCEQAEIFGRYLVSQGIRPSAIYAGALKRQIETARILETILHAENTMHFGEPALTEIDYGPWEGLTSDEIEKKWPNEYRKWTIECRWPDVFGGTREDHFRSIDGWLNELRKTYDPGKTVIGVTSNGIVRFFYSLLHTIDHTKDVKVKTGHFCEIQVFKNSIEIKRWNIDPKSLI